MKVLMKKQASLEIKLSRTQNHLQKKIIRMPFYDLMYNHIYRFMFEYHSRIFYDFKNGNSNENSFITQNTPSNDTEQLEGGAKEECNIEPTISPYDKAAIIN